jgi:hypothetical protein
MEFFNKKEDVIDIQITQYGKYLLSIGEFKPTHYSFFDGDILYDVAHANFSEPQNDSASRIKMDTPRPKTQYVFSGIESQFNTLKGIFEKHTPTISNPSVDWLNFGIVQQAPERNYTLSLPLGDSRDITYYNGAMTGSSEYLLGSNFGNIRIPQLGSDIKYKTYVTYLDPSDEDQIVRDYIPERLSTLGLTGGRFGRLDWFDDGSVIQIEPDYLFLDISEENTDFIKENFDIEVIMVETAKDSDGKIIKKEIPLYFGEGEKFNPEEHVQYYFDIHVDNEIDPELYCASKNRIKRKNIFSDQSLPFRCVGDEEENIINPYDASITSKDSEEIC